MGKEEILKYFNEINYAYNDSSKHDSLRIMLDDMEQEIRNKAIDELVSVAMERFTALDLSDILGTVTSCKIILRDIAEQMKGE